MPDETAATLYFKPDCVEGCTRNSHVCDLLDQWKPWFESLTEDQREQLRDKARWEQRTLIAVAREWGVDA